MAWVKVEQSLRDHRKLYALVDILNIESALALGLLVSLWLWAVDNAPTGSLAGISTRTIARAAQWTGDPDALIDALKQAKLLDDFGDALYIHDWAEYGGKLQEAREADKERQRRRRACKNSVSYGQPADVLRTSNGRVEEDKRTVDKTRPDQSTGDSAAQAELRSLVESEDVL